MTTYWVKQTVTAQQIMETAIAAGFRAWVISASEIAIEQGEGDFVSGRVCQFRPGHLNTWGWAPYELSTALLSLC